MEKEAQKSSIEFVNVEELSARQEKLKAGFEALGDLYEELVHARNNLLDAIRASRNLMKSIINDEAREEAVNTHEEIIQRFNLLNDSVQDLGKKLLSMREEMRDIIEAKREIQNESPIASA